jgi:hypothetical protein
MQQLSAKTESEKATASNQAVLPARRAGLTTKQVLLVIDALEDIHDNVYDVGKAVTAKPGCRDFHEIFDSGDHVALNYAYPTENIKSGKSSFLRNDAPATCPLERQREICIENIVKEHGGSENVTRDYDDYVTSGTPDQFLGTSKKYGEFKLQSDLALHRSLYEGAYQPFGCQYVALNKAGESLLKDACRIVKKWRKAGEAFIKSIDLDLGRLVCGEQPTWKELEDSVRENPARALDFIRPFRPKTCEHILKARAHA